MDYMHRPVAENPWDIDYHFALRPIPAEEKEKMEQFKQKKEEENRQFEDFLIKPAPVEQYGHS